MIRNYFIILFRGMVNQKFHTTINVICLTIGISFSLLIGIFIAGELEVNQSLKEVDRLYLIQNKVEGQASSVEWFSPGILPKIAVEQFSTQFEDYYRFWDRNITVSKGDKHFRIQSMIGDPSFLRIFGFKVLHGDVVTALKEPNSIIITEGVARRFFNKTAVENETLAILTEQNGLKDFRITAVIAEPDDKNTVSDLMEMNAQIFLSIENRADFFPIAEPDAWDIELITYIKVKPGVTELKAEATLNTILQTNAPQPVAEKRTIDLKALEDYYLITNHGAVLKLIFSLGAMVLFILILAITNFVNISIATSFSRLKEVGVRKVVGGVKQQLIFQFLMESILLASLAGLISLIFYQIVHVLFNGLLNAHLPSILNFKPTWWIWIATEVLVIGALAGIYPAFFQAATQPIELLKGKARSVQGTMSFSRVLISVQFLITIFIFIGAIILSTQVTYFLEKDLGYNKSSVLIVSSVPRIWNEEGFQKMDVAQIAFEQSTLVESVSLSWGSPGWNISPVEGMISEAGTARESGTKAYITGADENFDQVYSLKMREGVFLMHDNSLLKPGSLVLNESAQQALGVSLGDKIKVEFFDSLEFTLVGIVRDFHYESLHEAVKPIAFMHNRDFAGYRYFSFRLKPGNLNASVAEVERLWKSVFPNDPFDYMFAEEKLQSLYAAEMQLKKASTIASVLMLIIVMTGVLGLVSMSLSKRNKEIGIRKVMGASVANILVMLSKEYAVLITVAFVLAMPLAFYFSDLWLQSFVYHIPLSWWMFVLPGLFLLVVTVSMVCIQSYKTAVSDPVEALKYE